MLIRSTSLILILILLQGILAFPGSVEVEVEEDKEDDKRIIKGKDAAPGQFPFIVMLTYKGVISGINQTNKLCSGSIIAPNWVLTAGHCINGLNNEYTGHKWGKSIAAGTNNLWDDWNRYRQDIRMKATYIHPAYNAGKQPHDLALICLERPLMWNQHVQPIKLYQPGDLNAKEATAAGWGAYDKNNEYYQARDLQYIDPQPLVPQDECKKIYTVWEGYPSYVTDYHICLQSVNGTAPCAGDSGGPLVIKKDNEWRQLGVASFNKEPGKCGEYPTVYALVEHDWITETMKNKPC